MSDIELQQDNQPENNSEQQQKKQPYTPKYRRRKKRVLTEEHRRKLSEAGKGKKRSPEAIANMKAAAANRTEEHKRKLREHLSKVRWDPTGHVQTPEERKAHSDAIKRTMQETGFDPSKNWGTATRQDVRDKISATKKKQGEDRRSSTPYGWPVESRLNNYKNKAPKRGIKWDLTDEQARVLFLSPCAYCEKKPTLSKPGGIDRIDSDLGYMIGNVNPCCYVCNIMKNKYTLEEFYEQCKKIISVMDRTKQSPPQQSQSE